MQVMKLRRSTGLIIGMAILAASPLSYAQVQVQTKQADCTSANAIARHAYENVRTALLNRNLQALFDARRAFWDTEAEAGSCEQVQQLAKTLTQYHLGRPLEWEGTGGVTGGQGATGSGSGGVVSATVVNVELLAENDSGGGGASSSGTSGSSGTGSTDTGGWAGTSGTSGTSGSGTGSTATGSTAYGSSSSGSTSTGSISSTSPGLTRYRITLRKDDGTTETVIQDASPDLKSGDRVRLEDGVILREK